MDKDNVLYSSQLLKLPLLLKEINLMRPLLDMYITLNCLPSVSWQKLAYSGRIKVTNKRWLSYCNVKAATLLHYRIATENSPK